MKLDWVVLCREIRQEPAGYELLGLFYDGAEVHGPLPTVAHLNVAVVVEATRNEVDNGVLITTDIAVRHPDGSRYTYTPNIAAVSNSGLDPRYGELPVRTVMPFTLPLLVDQLGAYEIEISIGGESRVLPFVAFEPQVSS